MPKFNRRVIVRVEGRDVSEFRVSFDVAKNLRGRPNKAEIVVYNLAQETRRFLSEASDGARCVVLAGYESETPTAVFVGTLVRVEHARAGPDWLTRVSSGDGVPRAVRVAVSLGRGEALDRALGAVTQTLAGAGIGAGNSQAFAGTLRARTTGAGGLALSGSADVVLDSLLDDLGLEWSVQDQQLQILERGKPRQVRAAVVSPDSGLVGSPEVLEKGRVRVKSLLGPGLDPGLLIKLESRDLAGFYRVDSARYQGDTWGTAWYATLELRPVS